MARLNARPTQILNAMRHFVQYHNSDVFGPYRASKNRFGIVTDKPVAALVGDQVWLVVGRGRPREYFLGETFVVEDVGVRPQRPRNVAQARRGVGCTPLVRIDRAAWFPILQRATGNFAFGLQRINDSRVIAGLRKCAAETADRLPNDTPQIEPEPDSVRLR